MSQTVDLSILKKIQGFSDPAFEAAIEQRHSGAALFAPAPASQPTAQAPKFN